MADIEITTGEAQGPAKITVEEAHEKYSDRQAILSSSKSSPFSTKDEFDNDPCAHNNKPCSVSGDCCSMRCIYGRDNSNYCDAIEIGARCNNTRDCSSRADVECIYNEEEKHGVCTVVDDEWVTPPHCFEAEHACQEDRRCCSEMCQGPESWKKTCIRE